MNQGNNLVTLSLCIIVGKDEAEELTRVLKSAQGPLFEEIIVVLTQDDPAVERVAKQFADKTPRFPWIKDFAAARNFSFEQAKSSHILWLDADDEIPAQTYKALLERKQKLARVDVAHITYNYGFDKDGLPTLTLPRERIVRNHPSLRWADPIHEFITVHTGHIIARWNDLVIDHRRTRAYDPARNLEILGNLYTEGRSSPRNKFYYAKDLFDAGQKDEAHKIFLEYLAGPLDYNQNQTIACLRLAEYYKGKEEFEAFVSYLRKASLHCDAYAEPYFQLGLHLEGLKKLQEAAPLYEEASKKSATGLFAAKPYCYGKEPLRSLTRVYHELKDYEKALDAVLRYLALDSEDPQFIHNKKYLEDMVRIQKQEGLNHTNKTLPKEETHIAWLVRSLCPTDPSQRIRRLNINETLKAKGYDSEVIFGYDSVEPNWLDNHLARFNVIILSSFGEIERNLLKKAQGRGALALIDINEDILEHASVRDMLGLADGVVCCSNTLTQKAKTLSKRVVTIEDAYEELGSTEDLNYLRERQKPKALFIGMGGNSFLVTDYLKDVIDAAGYDLEVCTEWDNATVPWTLEGWREVMMNSDVVLCPQRIDVQPAKSNIKAAQAMAFGIPVLASPLPSYKEFIQTGANGYLCDTKEDWRKALEELKNPLKRIQIGLNGKDKVMSLFSLDVITDKWAHAISTLSSLPIVRPKETSTAPRVQQTVPIIIPVYNEVEYLKACITSIHLNTTTPYHIILSDAGSGEETWEYLRTLKGITVLGSPTERKSFSEAVNAGIATTGGAKYFAVLNSDVIVSKGWLANVVKKMDSVPRLAACGVLSNCDRGWLHGVEGRPVYEMKLPKADLELVPGMKYTQVMPHTDELHQFMLESNNRQEGKYLSQPWVAYYATVFARSAWDAVGGLDPIFKNGCEDLDHCRRLKAAHYEIGQALDSFVFHFGGISRGAYQDENRESYDKEDRTNHAIYHRKWEKKNVAIYTGPAWEQWNRDTVDRGMAGSETWASELGAALVGLGYAVTLFNDCPIDGEVDRYGVVYRHYSKYREWQEYLYVDHVILSRTVQPLKDIHIHSSDVSVMVHDIFLSPDRNHDLKAWAVKRFGCLSEWHVNYFSQHHKVPLEKIFLTANGVRTELYEDVGSFTKKNQAVYSSSPDRGLKQLLEMLPLIRKEVPDFEVLVAYGFHNWESMAKQRNNPAELKAIEEMKELCKQPGVQYLGRLSKEELAKRQKESKVWLFPSWFSETFCITSVEAGFSLNAVVTTPYAGILTTLGDTANYIKGPDHLPPEKWSVTPEYQEAFVQEAIRLLKDEPYRLECAQRVHEKVKGYTWEAAAKGWIQRWSQG